MKNIFYSLILLCAAVFYACQKDEPLGNIPTQGIELSFSGLSADLTNEVLTQTIESLHLIIYDENGKLIKHNEFENLSKLSPIKLPIGQYTFAYLSNIESGLVEGLETGKTLEDITLSLAESEGNILNAGSIFKGIDSIKVGQDNRSNATLQRLVGRLDINLKGIGNDIAVKSVTLTGSPKKISFSGEAKGESINLNIPMNKDKAGTYKGQAITFPTCDSIASLEFTLENNEGIKTFAIPLKNKVEANKIHTINAISNITGGLWNITLNMETAPWGATVTEDLTADEVIPLDTLRLFILFENQAQVDIEKLSRAHFSLKHDKTDKKFYLNDIQFSTFGDTLILTHALESYNSFGCGRYSIQTPELYDNNYNILYRSKKDVSFEVDSTGIAYAIFPGMPNVSESDRQAMLDLRDALPEGSYYGDLWKRHGEQINLWEGVELDENGRVITIGQNVLSQHNYRAIAANGLNDSVVPQIVWSIPESFKNLTQLKVFNEFNDYPVKEIPGFLKDMTALEQLSISCIDENPLPELPANLRSLNLFVKTTTLPAHISNLTKLEQLDFQCRPDEKATIIETDFSKMPALKSISLSANYDYNNQLPTSLWKCPQLEELSLWGFNNLQVPADLSLPSLTLLYISNNDLKPSHIENIKKLSLEFLGIVAPTFFSDESPVWLGNMSTLSYLTLNNCNLTHIPAILDNLTNLKDLNVQGNPDLSGKLPDQLLERYKNRMLHVEYDKTSNFSPDGIILMITPEKLEDFSPAGDTIQLEIRSNTQWFIDTNMYKREAIHFSKLAGEGNATITITVDPNRGPNLGYSRNFIIKISAGDHHLFLNAYQAYEQIDSQPSWWDRQVEYQYFGVFSMLKYRTIIKVTGKDSFENTQELTEAAAMMRNFLNENPIYEENGTLMTIPYHG